MSTQTKQREIPECFEQVETEDVLTLHNSNEGVLITVTERTNKGTNLLISEYPYKVTTVKNQFTVQKGAFKSKSEALEIAINMTQHFS